MFETKELLKSKEFARKSKVKFMMNWHFSFFSSGN